MTARGKAAVTLRDPGELVARGFSSEASLEGSEGLRTPPVGLSAPAPETSAA